MSLSAYLDLSADIIRQSAAAVPQERIDSAIAAVATALAAHKAVLVCGNGGSASDSMHIAGELVGRFLKERPAYKVICLASNPAVLTAWANDYSYDTVFSRQAEAYAEDGGVIIGISTSGNSANVIKAFEVAKSRGATTIALTGQGGGKMAAVSDILLDVPSKSTPLIQQAHVCLYHYLCEKVESRLS